jgi:hypothetical protein
MTYKKLREEIVRILLEHEVPCGGPTIDLSEALENLLSKETLPFLLEPAAEFKAHDNWPWPVLTWNSSKHYKAGTVLYAVEPE